MVRVIEPITTIGKNNYLSIWLQRGHIRPVITVGTDK